jgi:hypothetical protein
MEITHDFSRDAIGYLIALAFLRYPPGGTPNLSHLN